MLVDLEPAPRGGLAGYVERALKQALLQGTLRPGQRLVTRDLAAQLGTSPTPVREALLKLVAAGVLEAQSQAFQVPTISAARYQEIADIRLELEGLATARAALRITDGERAELRGINGRFQAAKRERDVPAALAANRAFRFGLYEAARMPVLLEMIERLWLQIGPALNFLYPQDIPSDAAQHTYAAVLDALDRRDAPAARAAIAHSIVIGTKILVGNLQDQADASPGR